MAFAPLDPGETALEALAGFADMSDVRVGISDVRKPSVDTRTGGQL